ncbi:FxSxx-COOH system tetratricopeptide repeat protein [Actinoplanes solisilvae]|uniref:FxSxx-COOH system tetratricopeptide repeat protein n=1 Tax=Actinoplanes solisilvae TaxID=2486853 RepID=UPI000FD74B07|nr:FxSxx-COOH system tetratricopeptide repeat protein [Actinoplanes solisilvae]
MTQTTAASSAEPVRPAIVSFVSPAPHSGRTSLVANLAWLVASAGHDVLVLDWDPRGSAVHEYLRPFLVAEGAVTSFLDDELSGVLNATMSVRSPAERAAPRLRRYAGAGPGESARLDVVRHEATPDSPTPAGDDLAVFLDLRRSLSDAGYDFIFLDGPPSERAVTAGRDGLFADSVVVCFQPDRESFEAATLLAVEVARHSAVRNRIIAVPGFFDDSDPARAHEHDEEMRSHLLRSLRAARTRIGPGALVQVPVPLYSLEHALVALAYEPSERKSLLEAYARLVSAVTGGVVERLPAVPRLVREVYAQRMGTPSHYEATDEPVEVIYHPADRPWGDWARAHLVAMGVPAVLRRLDGPPAESSATRVVLLSRLSSGLVNANGPVTGDTVVVRIDDAPPRMVPEGSRSIRVVGCPAEVARRRLVASFAGSADSVPRTTPAGDYPAAPRPGNRPFSVPATDPDLVDRPKLLESLRDSLDPATAGRVLLHGGASAGRTELAKSFAHRFAHGYDIVWFVPAHSRQAARSSLRRLGRQLGVDAGGDEAEAALLLLRDDRLPYLLVYDGVADLGAIGDLLPPAGSGHVVITLEGEVPGWATGTPIEVGPLTEDEAVRTLGIQLPTFRFADLRPVARAVGTAPLTLRLTAGYLSVLTGSLDNAGPPTSDDTVAAVDEFVTAIGAGTPSDDRLVDVGRLMFDRLGNTDAGRLVVTLTKICANLSPDGVSLALLRSTAFLQCLIELAGDAAESLAEDGGEIEYTFAAGARTALFTVDWGGERLHTHRGVQRMVQALQSGEEREEVRLRTLDALAAYAPSDALFGARSGWDRLAELARHVGPSGALEETSSREVRRWVTLHFAYASNLSDSEGWAETALAAEDVLARWPTSDRLSTRLSTHHADLLRQLGRYDEALHADVDNLADLQVLVGSAHLRASYVRRGMAGDLRGLGLFAEARAEDVTVYRTFKTLLGPDHPQTLASLHNLALSNYLDGRQEDAVVREREVFERRGRLLGPNHFLTWWSGLDLGIYLRELGRLDEARRMLRAAVDNLGRMLGAEDPLTLRAVVAEGVAQRRTAAGGRARGTISKAVTVLDQVLGPRAIETQAARMSLATDLAVQGGDLTDAIDVAREALEVYRERVGASHPFVALCRVNLGALLRQAGHLDDARTELTDALSLLDARSAAMHPWKIAGRVNLANVLLCQGACDEATTLMIDTLNAAEQILPAGHPYLKLLAGSLMNVDTWRICVARGVPLPGLIDVDVELPKT